MMNAKAHSDIGSKANSEQPAHAQASGQLQRKCDCGQHTVAGGECGSCQDKQKEKLQRSAVSHDDLSYAPPVVDDALRSAGQSLDASTRAFMEPRFGRDFSRVRVHTDARAAASALAVNAQAYTVGSDIVFAPGQYEPHTSAGRHLLGHELAHVRQQGENTINRSSLELDHPESRAELEARATADALMRDEPVKATGGNAGIAPVVHRSILGGIVGGLLGAGAGIALGASLGPIGAIIGGIAGFALGAIIGDQVSRDERSLNADELANAKDIFKESLDYSEITITRGSMFVAGALGRTLGNTIHLASSLFEKDSMELTDTPSSYSGRKVLIHEMGHVWQYQNGGLAYIPDSIWSYIKQGVKGTDPLDWESAHKAGLPWEKWSAEQQAEAISAYNVALEASKSPDATLDDMNRVAILLPYMQKVWNREGAPHNEVPQDAGSVMGGSQTPSGP
jgi:hypothetical protein